jgi:hypothetical protein
LKQFTIALELENKAAGPANIPAIPYLFDRVEVLAEGGNVQIARYEPMHLYAPFRHVEGPAFDLNYKLALFPPADFSMAVGAKASYFVPILNCPFGRNEAYLGHIKSDIFIRVWFVGASRFPTGNIPTLTKLSVIAEQDVYAPHERMQLHERALSQSLDLRFGRPNFQSMVETLAPNTRYSFVLTAVQGIVSELIITIRNANPTGFSAYSFRGWQSYELLDGSGASLTGGMPVTSDYQRSIVDASRQSSGALDALSGMLGSKNTPLVIEFGSAKSDLLTGSITGYVPFSGTERLIITTESTLTPGSYEIRVEYLSVARVNITNGHITVLPS